MVLIGKRIENLIVKFQRLSLPYWRICPQNNAQMIQFSFGKFVGNHYNILLDVHHGHYDVTICGRSIRDRIDNLPEQCTPHTLQHILSAISQLKACYALKLYENNYYSSFIENDIIYDAGNVIGKVEHGQFIER